MKNYKYHYRANAFDNTRNPHLFSGLCRMMLLFVLMVILLPNGLAQEESDTLSYYPELASPEHLNVIDRSDMNLDEYIMMITLQGNLAQEKPRIYITGRESDEIWLESLKTNFGVTTEVRTDPMGLLEQFKGEVDGYILADWDTPSFNTATSLAGIKNGIVITEALESEIKSLGIEKLLDAREIEPGSVFDNYKNEFNNSLLFTSDSFIIELRDYMIAAKGLVYHEDADVEGNFFNEDTLYNWVENDVPQIGWGGVGDHDEFNFVNNATRGGLFTNPANWNRNLSALAGADLSSLQQNHTEATTENIETPEEAHYLSLLSTDGDNYAFVLQGLVDEGKFLDSPINGEFPMNWTIPATIIDLAPAAMKELYDRQASEKDYFVVGGTGAGYMHPSQYPYLDEHLERTNKYMKRSDLSYVGMLDPVEFGSDKFHETASVYAAQSNIEGGYYVYPSDVNSGSIEFVDGKPFVATRGTLGWEMGEEEIIELAEKINNYAKDPEVPGAYSLINFGVLTHQLEDAKILVDHLDPHVKVVNLDELFQQIKKNVDPDYDPYADISFGDNLLPNNDFADGFGQWRLVKDNTTADFQDVDEVYFSGTDGQILSYTGYNLLQIFSERVDAEAGKHYKLQVKTQVTGEHGRAANYKIRFYNENGDFLDEIEQFMPENTEGFVNKEAIMQAPEQTAKMDVELAVWDDDPDLEIQIKEVLLQPGTDQSTGTEQAANIPEQYNLKQNYPNPFNPSTRIEYSLKEASDVTLEVFNMQGQRVTKLVNKYQSAGTHNVNFNASSLSSGMYIYRLETGNYNEVKKMILVK